MGSSKAGRVGALKTEAAAAWGAACTSARQFLWGNRGGRLRMGPAPTVASHPAWPPTKPAGLRSGAHETGLGSLVEDEVQPHALGAALPQHAHQQGLALLTDAHAQRGLGAGLGLGGQAGLGGWGKGRVGKTTLQPEICDAGERFLCIPGLAVLEKNHQPKGVRPDRRKRWLAWGSQR